MFKRILVPTDGSQLAHKAVANAVDLAASVGAEIVALNVTPCYAMSSCVGGSPLPAEELARVERDSAESALALVREIGTKAAKAGVRVRTVTMRSDVVADAILAAARKHGCDLVVMGSHARTGLRRLLLGSETEHVLAHSDIPVLVLR